MSLLVTLNCSTAPSPSQSERQSGRKRSLLSYVRQYRLGHVTLFRKRCKVSHLPAPPPRSHVIYSIRPGIFHAYQTVIKSHAVGFRMCTPEHTLKGKHVFQEYREEAHSIVGEFGERVEGRGLWLGFREKWNQGWG